MLKEEFFKQFVLVPKTVIDTWPKIGVNAITLYTYFCYVAGDTDTCSPTYTEIQDHTKMRREIIAKALDVLEGFGFIERHRRFGASTVYVIVHKPE